MRADRAPRSRRNVTSERSKAGLPGGSTGLCAGAVRAYPWRHGHPAARVVERSPGWRTDPYRVLFPLGVLLAWAGVLHWLLLATGVIGEYRSIFHAFAQIEGFMTCFAVGFLFTLIPRRTATALPAAWQMAVGDPARRIQIAISIWYEKWALSQIPGSY